MDKYTWIYITIRIDMKVTSSSCNTSSYILRIILEIHSKNSFCRTILSDLVIHLLTLLWIRLFTTFSMMLRADSTFYYTKTG